MTKHNWEKIAAAKREALAEKIPPHLRIPKNQLPAESQLNVTTWPKESGWFTEKELETTESTALVILGKIASKAWSAEDVTVAFCKRAAAAQQLVPQQPRLHQMKADTLIDELSQRCLLR
jgi:amidase